MSAAGAGHRLALYGTSGRRPIIGSSLSIAALIAILGQALYPKLVPGRLGTAGLTVSNSASSDLTLTVMLVIALIGMPLVLGYTAFIYRHFWRPVEPGAEEGY